MDSERWKIVRSIALEARELSGEERSAFLDQACGDDRELHQEVESFLNADLEKVDFMEQSPIRILGETDELEKDSEVGAYRVIRKLGSGGMGIVYLASRIGDEFEHEVALKVLQATLPAGQTSDEAEQRFLQEMGILAKLKHPNIAQLHSGGRTEDGRLYYLMEYIEGKRIDAYCRDEKLSLEDRLRLFQKVCDAVQYAHTKLVIHRDLKPSNVLVTTDGEPKLLDFGVAKLLAEEGAAVNVGVTVLTGGDQKLFTPDYASPEQITGQDIHIASDVYSLGILLYELLAGNRPYRLKAQAEKEIRSIVCDQTPEPPSTVLTETSKSESSEDPPATDPTTASFKRKLEGDLDTIVLMALRKEPGRRYPTVQKLADDIEKYLTGLPIDAREPSPGYKARKFLKRNRIGLAIAGLFLVVIGIAAFALWGQYQETVRQRDLAQHRLRQANVTRRFLIGLFENSEPDEAHVGAIAVAQVLENGSQKVYEELAQEPAIRAEVEGVIGEIYRVLGLFGKAEGHLQSSVGDSLKAMGRESAQHASALNDLATLKQELGEYDEAEDMFRQALEIRLSQLGEQHEETAYSLNNLATIFWIRGNLEATEKLDRRALAVLRQAYPGDHIELAKSIDNLAILLRDRGKESEAEPLYLEALEMRKRLFQDPHSHLAYSYTSYGRFLHQYKGDLQQATELITRALETRRQLLGEQHHLTQTTAVYLAEVLWLQGNYCDAQKHLETALQLVRQATKPPPILPFILVSLGKVHRSRSSLDRAELYSREALSIETELVGTDSLKAAQALHELGAILLDQGSLSESQEVLNRALQIRERDLGKHHEHVADVHLQIAILECARGNYAKSKELAKEAINTLAAELPAGHWKHWNAKGILGCSLMGLGESAAAESLLLASLRSLDKNPGRASPPAIRTLQRVLDFYRQSGQREKVAEHEQELARRFRSQQGTCQEAESPPSAVTENGK